MQAQPVEYQRVALRNPRPGPLVQTLVEGGEPLTLDELTTQEPHQQALALMSSAGARKREGERI